MLYIGDGLDLRPVQLLPPRGVHDLIYIDLNMDRPREALIDAISDGLETLGYTVTLDDDPLTGGGGLRWFFQTLLQCTSLGAPRVLQHEKDLPHGREYLRTLISDCADVPLAPLAPLAGAATADASKIRVRHLFEVALDASGLPVEPEILEALSGVDSIVCTKEQLLTLWLDRGIVKGPVRVVHLPGCPHGGRSPPGPPSTGRSPRHVWGHDVFLADGSHKGFA